MDILKSVIFYEVDLSDFEEEMTVLLRAPAILRQFSCLGRFRIVPVSFGCKNVG